jgi:putative ABC transport system substrate-binding protein
VDLDSAIARLAELQAGAFLTAPDNVINSRLPQLIALAARYKLPAVYQEATAVAAGGLMSYSSDCEEMWRSAGTYVGRILKGEKPADLPVQQATRIGLAINIRTAKRRGSHRRLCLSAPTR